MKAFAFFVTIIATLVFSALLYVGDVGILNPVLAGMGGAAIFLVLVWCGVTLTCKKETSDENEHGETN